MRVADVFDKPIACELCDFLQRPWFFEEMRRARDDLEFHFAVHPIACLLV